MRLLAGFIGMWVGSWYAYRLPLPPGVAPWLTAAVFVVAGPPVLERSLRSRSAQPQPLIPSQPQPLPTPAPSAYPVVAPGFWDGEGWVEHDGDLIYKQGDGHFYSQNRQEWVHRPDLLTGALPAPPPPPMGMRVQQEVHNLRTGWPTPMDAWRLGRTDRAAWLLRLAVVALPVVFALAVRSLMTADEPSDAAYVCALGSFSAFPVACAYLYVRACWVADRRKGIAALVGLSAFQYLFHRSMEHTRAIQGDPAATFRTFDGPNWNR